MADAFHQVGTGFSDSSCDAEFLPSTVMTLTTYLSEYGVQEVSRDKQPQPWCQKELAGLLSTAGWGNRWVESCPATGGLCGHS